MIIGPTARYVLEEIERRKLAKEDPCDSCGGLGGDADTVCLDCLGQGVLLTREEYDTLLEITGLEDAMVLDQQIFED